MNYRHTAAVASALAMLALATPASAGTRPHQSSVASLQGKGGASESKASEEMERIKKLPPGLVGKCGNPDFPGAKGIAQACRNRSAGS